MDRLTLSVIAVAVSACRPPPCSDGTAPAASSVTRAEIEASSTLAALSIVVDNYQPVRNPSDQTFAFRNVNGSSVSVDPPGYPMVAESFDIFPSRSDPYTIYIDDLRSTRVRFTTNDYRLVLTADFAPATIRTDCINNIICVDNPNFFINGLQITIALTLDVSPEGRLTYSNAEVQASLTTTPAPGLCQNNFFAFLCNWLAPSNNDVKTKLESTIRTTLMSEGMRSAISAGLDCAMRSLGRIHKPLTYVAIDASGQLAVNYCPQSDDLSVSTAACGM